MDDNFNIIHGINFASADYLGLAQNESAKEAAISAAREFGVNSAGSPLAFGATKYFKLKTQILYATQGRARGVLGLRPVDLFGRVARRIWSDQRISQIG